MLAKLAKTMSSGNNSHKPYTESPSKTFGNSSTQGFNSTSPANSPSTAPHRKMFRVHPDHLNSEMGAQELQPVRSTSGGEDGDIEDIEDIGENSTYEATTKLSTPTAQPTDHESLATAFGNSPLSNKPRFERIPTAYPNQMKSQHNRPLPVFQKSLNSDNCALNRTSPDAEVQTTPSDHANDNNSSSSSISSSSNYVDHSPTATVFGSVLPSSSSSGSVPKRIERVPSL